MGGFLDFLGRGIQTEEALASVVAEAFEQFVEQGFEAWFAGDGGGAEGAIWRDSIARLKQVWATTSA
jgi:hypothetical protein